jgi:hypothetical protein
MSQVMIRDDVPRTELLDPATSPAPAAARRWPCGWC